MTPAILLLLLPALAGLLAQTHVRRTFERYAQPVNRLGITGAEVAEKLLGAFSLFQIEVQRVDGALTDHYDPSSKRLRLSRDVADRASISSLGIAAHEVGHAVQDAEGFRLHRLRMRLGERMARISPLAGLLFIGGLLMRVPPLTVAAVAFIALSAVFALVTLPTEINASRRAMTALEDTGLAHPDEIGQVRRVLRAAALTYVAGLSRKMGLFLFIVVGTVLAQQLV